MAAHRYWRLTAFSLRAAGALELSEAQLWADSTRVDASAALSATVTAYSGTLSSLKDGSAATVVSWPLSSWSAPGFALVWDFGAGGDQDVTRLRLGSGTSAATFPRNMRLEWSDDGAFWTVSADLQRITYPGVAALTQDPATFVLTSVPTTWNPADKGSATLSNGNLTSTGDAYGGTRSIFSAASGKWYWETKWVTYGSAPLIGVANASAPNNYPGWDANGWSYYLGSGDKYNAGSASAYGAGGALNDIISVLLDLDAGTLEFWKNGVSQGVAFSGGFGGVPIFAMTSGGASGPKDGVTANFGGSAFAYTPPAGFTAGFGEFRYPVIPTDAPQPVRLTSFVARSSAWPGADRPAGAASAVPTRMRSFNNVNFGGWGRIYGTVAKKHSPANIPLLSKRVFLIDETSMVVVASTFSDPVTGAFEFKGVREGVPYTVISYDEDHNFSAAVLDNKIPDPWSVWGS